MDDHEAVAGDQKRLSAQPIGKFGAVGRVEQAFHGVAIAMRMAAVDHRQEVQVVVAENGSETRPECTGVA